MMKKDIENAEDIELLVNSFYNQVKADGVIGYIFNETIGADWSHHLPIMYRFWNSVLFGKLGYSGHPVNKHVELSRKIPLHQEHFNRWLQMWNETVDSLFEGDIAALAKN